MNYINFDIQLISLTITAAKNGHLPILISLYNRDPAPTLLINIIPIALEKKYYDIANWAINYKYVCDDFQPWTWYIGFEYPPCIQTIWENVISDKKNSFIDWLISKKVPFYEKYVTH